MRVFQKALLVSGFTLLFALSGFTALSYTTHCIAVLPKSAVPAISSAQFEALQKSGWINLTDDTCAEKWWVAIKPKVTMPKILAWLKTAKPYTGKIPKTANVIFYANVGPSTIFLRNSDKRFITAEPEWYVISSGTGRASVSYIQNVVKLNIYGKTAYVVSNPLYDWLKKDRWKSAFREGFH